MCGICGKISLNGDVSEELIRKMCGVLTHREPDDEGVEVLYSPATETMADSLEQYC